MLNIIVSIVILIGVAIPVLEAILRDLALGSREMLRRGQQGFEGEALRGGRQVERHDHRAQVGFFGEVRALGEVRWVVVRAREVLVVACG